MAATGVPGEALRPYLQTGLREAGFEPGYPVYLYGQYGGDGMEVDDLNDILHMATTPKLEDPPVMLVGFRVFTRSGEDERHTLPMQVRDIRRCWRAGPRGAYWYLGGQWDPAEAGERFVNRKQVSSWMIHIRLDTLNACVQFVPKDWRNRNLLDPDGDDFRWGERSSRALPTPYRKK